MLLPPRLQLVLMLMLMLMLMLVMLVMLVLVVVLLRRERKGADPATSSSSGDTVSQRQHPQGPSGEGHQAPPPPPLPLWGHHPQDSRSHCTPSTGVTHWSPCTFLKLHHHGSFRHNSTNPPLHRYSHATATTASSSGVSPGKRASYIPASFQGVWQRSAQMNYDEILSALGLNEKQRRIALDSDMVVTMAVKTLLCPSFSTPGGTERVDKTFIRVRERTGGIHSTSSELNVDSTRY